MRIAVPLAFAAPLTDCSESVAERIGCASATWPKWTVGAYLIPFVASVCFCEHRTAVPDPKWLSAPLHFDFCIRKFCIDCFCLGNNIKRTQSFT